MSDYQNIDIDVKAKDNASTILDTIIKKLKTINDLMAKNNKAGNAVGGTKTRNSKGNSKGNDYYQEHGTLNDKDSTKAIAKGNEQVYKSAKKNVSAFTELSNVHYNLERTNTLLANSTRKLADVQISSNNTNIVAKNNMLSLEQMSARVSKQTALINNEKYKELVTQKELNTAKAKEIQNQVKIEQGLKKIKTETKKVTAETKKSTAETKKQSNAMEMLQKTSKIAATLAVIKRGTAFLADTLSVAGDWIEALNLFEVTMGSASEASLDFAMNLSSAYGVARNELIKYMGLFTQMTSAIGVQQDLAVDLGETLTAVGIDIASFYNRTTESSMEMIRATIAGQTKPGRQYGFDFTAQSLDQYIQENLGYQGTSKMLQQETKVMLRSILLLEQSRNAWGDMAKTVNSFENQMKVLQGTMQNFKLVLGNAIIEPAKVAIIWINGFFIALTEVIELFSKVPATTGFGNAIQEQTNIAQEGIDDLAESMGLFDFDKFNVLNKGGEGTSKTELDALIQEEYWKLSTEYQQTMADSLENIANKANEVAKIFKNILFPALAAVAGIALVSSMYKWVTAMGTVSVSLKSLTRLSTALRVGGIFLLVASIMTLITSWDTLTDSQKAIYISLAALGALMIVFSNKTMMVTLLKALSKATLAFNGLARSTKLAWGWLGVIIMAIASVTMALSDASPEIKEAAGIVMVLAGAFMAATAAALALFHVVSWGSATPFIIGGIAAAVAGVYQLVDSTMQQPEVSAPPQGETSAVNASMNTQGRQAVQSSMSSYSAPQSLDEQAMTRATYNGSRFANGENTNNQPTYITVQVGDEKLGTALINSLAKGGKKVVNV